MSFNLERGLRKMNKREHVLLGELDIIVRQHFPIGHKDCSCNEKLQEWSDEYILKLEKSELLSDDEKQQIEFFTNGLIKCHKKYLNKELDVAQKEFNALMDSVKNCLNYSFVGMNNNYNNIRDTYYRIRTGTEQYTYLEMLHIPFSKAASAPSSRFSIKGEPCSYMSNSKATCWYECHMPNHFQLAEYKFFCCNNKLLRLDINPVQIKNTLRVFILGREFEITKIEKTIKEIYFTFPLLASCSLVAENKDKEIIEEYIIPQMLMKWVKENTEFIGVRYYSNSKVELIEKNPGYNIAIPAIRDNGDYSETLKSLFNVDYAAKSESINLIDCFFNEFSEDIERLREINEKICDELQSGSNSTDIQNLYKEYYLVCKDILLLLEQLKKIEIYNIFSVMCSIKSLFLWINELREKVDLIKSNNSYDEDSVNKNIEVFEKISKFVMYIRNFFKVDELWEN